MNKSKKFRSKVGTFDMDYDVIEYQDGISFQLAYEFNIFNLGEEDIEIQFNKEGDYLILEPGEGFDTNIPIEHAIIKTDGATVKYSYWI